MAVQEDKEMTAANRSFVKGKNEEGGVEMELQKLGHLFDLLGQTHLCEKWKWVVKQQNSRVDIAECVVGYLFNLMSQAQLTNERKMVQEQRKMELKVSRSQPNVLIESETEDGSLLLTTTTKHFVKLLDR